VADHALGASEEAGDVSDLIRFFGDEPGLLADKTLEHLIIAALAIAIALVLALPAGVLLGHTHRGSFVAINVSNVLRALPSLALIAISLAFIGLSRLNITIALVALALPPILTNAYTAVDKVDPDAVESARGMGMNERQVLTVVELPLSWPLIFAGIRTASVYVIATAPLAAIAGGGGLGDIILNQPTYGLEGVVAATIVTVVLAFAVDGLLGLVQQGLTPSGLVVSKELHTIVPPAESDLPADRAVSVNP
jgi:osmoprotectant transport system permease protein